METLKKENKTSGVFFYIFVVTLILGFIAMLGYIFYSMIAG